MCDDNIEDIEIDEKIVRDFLSKVNLLDIID